MTSPSSTPMRRRQRSTRLMVAGMLLLVGVLAVAGAALSGSWLVATVAAALGVVLGAAATRITHTELAEARREAARDRAEQAGAYRDLTVDRIAEHASYVDAMTSRISAHQETIAVLERDLDDAQGCLIEAHRLLVAEQLRADDSERAVTALTRRLDDAEERAAEAIMRVAEIERELDVVTAEWQAAELSRKRA